MRASVFMVAACSIVMGASGCGIFSSLKRGSDGPANECFKEPQQATASKEQATTSKEQATASKDESQELAKKVDRIIKIGTTYLRAKREKDSIDCFDYALRLAPDKYEANLKYGVAALSRARQLNPPEDPEAAALIESAKKRLGRAYLIRQGYSEPIYYLAEAAVLEKNYPIAKQLLSEFISNKEEKKYDAHPMAGAAAALLGFIDTVEGRPRSAKEDFEWVKKFGGPDPTVQYAVRMLKGRKDSGEARSADLPPFPMHQDSRTPIVTYREFRLEVMHFGKPAKKPEKDDKGSGEDFSIAIPAWLISDLKTEGRFTVFEAGEVGLDTKIIGRTNAGDLVDGYLEGTVTPSASAHKVCFTVRLANAHNHEVLFGSSRCTAMGAELGHDIRSLAHEIARAVRQVNKARVVSADGRLVVIDKGSGKGVTRGMVAYIVPTARKPENIDLHDVIQDYAGQYGPRADEQPVVGELYIVSVNKENSIGQLYTGDYALPGDVVMFK